MEMGTYLVCLMCRSCSNFALLARCELSKVTVVIALPTRESSRLVSLINHSLRPARECIISYSTGNVHLMVEDLGLARLSLWNERLVQNIKDILADFLEFGLNLLSIVTNGANVLVRALRLLFLLNGRDYAPRCTSGSNNILVGDREKVSFVNSELTTQLLKVRNNTVNWLCASS